MNLMYFSNSGIYIYIYIYIYIPDAVKNHTLEHTWITMYGEFQ